MKTGRIAGKPGVGLSRHKPRCRFAIIWIVLCSLSSSCSRDYSGNFHENKDSFLAILKIITEKYARSHEYKGYSSLRIHNHNFDGEAVGNRIVDSELTGLMDDAGITEIGLSREKACPGYNFNKVVLTYGHPGFFEDVHYDFDYCLYMPIDYKDDKLLVKSLGGDWSLVVDKSFP